MLDILKDGPINPENSKYQVMLCNLQGNILKPHGRAYAVHIFLKFKPNKEGVCNWMGGFADRYVTSAEQQCLDAEQRTKEKLFGNLFLSATGYEALGYSWEEIKCKFAVDQEKEDQHLAILRFTEGMEDHGQLLNDPAPETWEWAYRGRKIDAMILLAHAETSQLLGHMCTVLSEVAIVADVLTVELGHKLRNASGDSVEPFGYRDGISQPVFLQKNAQSTPPVFNPSEWQPSDPWTPSASLDLVLLPDPFATSEQDCFGSYLVFRKLEQNIRGFHQRIRELAGLLECDIERAQALVLGRFRDGTPLVKHSTPLSLSPTVKATRSETDNFDYQKDRGGDKCPFQAHIRRLNPRHESAAHQKQEEIKREIVQAERRHRIVRRSIPYGMLPQDYLSGAPHEYLIDQLPTCGVGILFMCFQRSLSNQFGYLQTVLANSESRSAGTQTFVGVDPIIGQPTANQSVTPNPNHHVTLEGNTLPVEPLWPKRRDEPPYTPFPFQGFVTLKGGEFLFAPSLHFLKNPRPPGEGGVKG
jgi:deferrochelatase/peroxidase EfeB